MNSLFARLGGLALALSAAAAPAFAADEQGPVVAEVNGTRIHAAALAAYQRTLPAQVASQAPYGALLDVVVNNQLVAEQARKDGLDKDPDVKKALQDIESQLMAKAWMNKKLKAAVNDATIKAAYDKYLAAFKPEDEVHARHILTESEDEAKGLLAEIRKGADFTELAKMKSKDPTAKSNGGDLGFFTKEEMVKEFAEAAFAMQAGQVSTAPIKTQFGWHVIKVEEHRPSVPPSFDQAKPMIREQLAEDVAQKLVYDLRSKAKVKLYDQNGQAFEAKPAKQPQ